MRSISALLLVCATLTAAAQDVSPQTLPLPVLGPYEYEAKPEGEAFVKLNPRKAPEPGAMLLRSGDRLAIVGDSITEQRMYSRLIETYLTACMPDLNVSVRQYGWSGEKTDGFLRRMDNDCLRFDPTIATLCYGMNDARYRPFDITNGKWYEDHYTAIVRKLKNAGAKVVVGSPGCSGKLATWVQSRSGTLEEHNQHLCALRDIAMGVAQREQVAFADVFWPMYKARVAAPGLYLGDGSQPYEIVGRDGIHPDWAGHAIMAYAFLTSLGLDGDLGTISVNLENQSGKGEGGHHVERVNHGEIHVTSERYCFCAPGPIDRDDSVRSGMTFVPFDEKLNRLTLKVTGVHGIATITWGGASKTFSARQLADGINLAAEFTDNPFCDAFARVDDAVAAKQEYETKQIKQIFHGRQGRDNMEKAVKDSEQEREPLVAAVHAAMKPVKHVIKIEN
ncbi:SGNH/GDSL hydrolase family protein [Stieleria sp. JC731]|uniref:SGNH/GDSL hydrolase family protein n=1 Tax=Pirellulaceae TaxID=2691357 RepID=UPI001E292FF3|nr:SGNH/GDSL hydrolase family protein [Stieleria sp. JC731]MCC9601065.1 SGNH/GDSL hydrolase family protein [Stieleria sp. JC731]